MDGLPVFITVSQTSLRAVDTLLRGLTAEGIFHYSAVVELSLEKRKGQRADYAVLIAKKVGDVGSTIGAKAKEKFTATLTDVVDPDFTAASASASPSNKTEDIPF